MDPMADGKFAKIASTERRRATVMAQGDVYPSVKSTIMETALRTFAQHGFDGTSMSDIAKRCGVSQPLVHYHFSSKTLLWREAVAQEMATVYRALSRDDGEDVARDPVARFSTFLRGYVHIVFKRPYIFAIIIKETDILGDRFEWLREKRLPQFYRIWEAEIEGLKNENLMRSKAPNYHIAQMLVGACNHFVSSRYRVLPLYDRDPDDPSLPREHADLVLDLVLHGLLAKPVV